ncbi:UNVERIFIED_CONTAM: hypothetical protein ABID98_004359 [Brevibacillus sp. OAP136]
MNIHENVEKRAAHALSLLVRQFSFPLSQQDRLTYRSGDEAGSKWGIRYTRAKKWISRVYKPEITYMFALPDTADETYRLSWNPGKKQWKSTEDHGSRLIGRLNEHRDITQLLASVDMEKVELFKNGNEVTLTLIPIPGCFIWTLIPPIHYFVRIKPEEAAVITDVALRIEHAVLHDESAMKKAPAI